MVPPLALAETINDSMVADADHRVSAADTRTEDLQRAVDQLTAAIDAVSFALVQLPSQRDFVSDRRVRQCANHAAVLLDAARDVTRRIAY